MFRLTIMDSDYCSRISLKFLVPIRFVFPLLDGVEISRQMLHVVTKIFIQPDRGIWCGLRVLPDSRGGFVTSVLWQIYRSRRPYYGHSAGPPSTAAFLLRKPCLLLTGQSITAVYTSRHKKNRSWVLKIRSRSHEIL